MGDVKTLLKEARKLIDEKNFKEAQECCKNILRKDKQNYLGLILLGKSLQDSDQAPLAYQKAIAIKQDHPLAWQGLANYYERKNDSNAKSKLFTIYDEILKLQIEEEKALEVITKLSQLGCSLKNKQSISTLIYYMNMKLDPILHAAAEKQFLELVKADVPCNSKDIPTVLNILSNVIIRDSDNQLLPILYAKVVLQKNDFAAAVEEIIRLNFFSNSVILREWLCQYLCKKFIEKDSFCDFDIERHVDQILTGIENSKYPNLLKSMICYSKGLYLDAYKQCVPLINYHDADITEARFVIHCTIMLKKWAVTQKLATNFLMKVKDKDFTIILKRYLFLSLAEQQKWKQAISVVKEIPNGILEINEQALLAKCYIETEGYAEEVMKKLDSTEHFAQLEALSLLKQEKYNEAVALLEKSEHNALNLFYLGKAFWGMKQYDKCLINLLQAAKLDSEHSDTFLYLGNFYYQHKNDLAKAKKCYEKSYSLNNNDSETVKKLSEVYNQMKLTEEDFSLLIEAKNNIELYESWINFRLGIHYLNKGEWENAILNFRTVVKNYQNNITAYECLADAYYSRGSFTSALKAYNKVMTLESSKTIHCLTRVGYIHSLLTQYEDAIKAFESVLKIDCFSFLALKGISETWMRLAKKKISANLYGSARDNAQYAINYMTLALSKEKKYLCFWDLLGHALMFVSKLPSKYCFVYMKKTLNDNCEELANKDKIEIIKQALTCFTYVAKRKGQITSRDLASAYLSYYHTTNEIVNCHISFKLSIACISEKPSTWQSWNLLGRICIYLKKYDIAQHCFIKALLVTRKWSVAQIWCNLGALYIKLKLYKVANYCFWRGQSILPSYPQSWIGQAYIAEEVREEEAMDLFRHASRLGYHPASALGYGDWVCRTLKKENYKNNAQLVYDIEGLHAVTYAMDLIEWYCTYETKDASAYSILGILQEKTGLLQTALQTFEKALLYASDDKMNIIRLSIGRILIKLGKYDESVNVYKSVTEASLNSACGLALCLFKNGVYEESYSAYDTALHWLSNDDDEKADILVAMAGIVYMYKGIDDAKTILFHSVQVSQQKPTASSLFAICSLGIMHNDSSLSKLALSELQKYEKNSRYGFEIGFLKSFFLVNENMEQAIKVISDSLHDHPNNALLWFCLAQYCLKATNMKPKVASCCAQRAICSAYSNEHTCNSGKMIATASIAEQLAGDSIKAMILAKKGLHMYPCQTEIWAALIYSVVTHKQWLERKQWLVGATGYMRRHLNISRPVSRWVSLLEKKLNKHLCL